MSKLFNDLIDATEGMAVFLKGKKRKKISLKNAKIVPVAKFSAAEITQLRVKLKLSQSALAAILGVTERTVRAWETGAKRPTGPAARMIDLLERKPEEVVPLYLRHA